MKLDFSSGCVGWKVNFFMLFMHFLPPLYLPPSPWKTRSVRLCVSVHTEWGVTVHLWGDVMLPEFNSDPGRRYAWQERTFTHVEHADFSRVAEGEGGQEGFVIKRRRVSFMRRPAAFFDQELWSPDTTRTSLHKLNRITSLAHIFPIIFGEICIFCPAE